MRRGLLCDLPRVAGVSLSPPPLRLLSSSPRQTSVTVSLSSFSDSRTASLGSNWGNMTLALDNLAGGQADQLKWIKRPGRDSNPSTRPDRPGLLTPRPPRHRPAQSLEANLSFPI